MVRAAHIYFLRGVRRVAAQECARKATHKNYRRISVSAASQHPPSRSRAGAPRDTETRARAGQQQQQYQQGHVAHRRARGVLVGGGARGCAQVRASAQARNADVAATCLMGMYIFGSYQYLLKPENWKAAMRVVVECSPCRARIAVILSLVGYATSWMFSRYLLVPSTMKIATSRGLLRWLAGWLAGHRFGPLYGLVASGHSGFACGWHVHSTAGTWNKIPASSVLVGARTHIELALPNGPMVAMAVGHARHNNKSIHCLNHSGGDNHRVGAARCGNHVSLNERHLCWHSDPSLDRERHNRACCHFHHRPHGEEILSRKVTFRFAW